MIHSHPEAIRLLVMRHPRSSGLGLHTALQLVGGICGHFERQWIWESDLRGHGLHVNSLYVRRKITDTLD